MLKRLAFLFYPFLLPALAFYSLPSLQTLPAAYHSLVSLFPYIAIGAGALLAWRFNRGRVFFSLMLLLGLYLGLGLRPEANDTTWRWLLMMISLLLPLNLLLLGLFRERGILTMHGAVRFAFLAL